MLENISEGERAKYGEPYDGFLPIAILPGHENVINAARYLSDRGLANILNKSVAVYTFVSGSRGVGRVAIEDPKIVSRLQKKVCGSTDSVTVKARFILLTHLFDESHRICPERSDLSDVDLSWRACKTFLDTLAEKEFIRKEHTDSGSTPIGSGWGAHSDFYANDRTYEYIQKELESWKSTTGLDNQISEDLVAATQGKSRSPKRHIAEWTNPHPASYSLLGRNPDSRYKGAATLLINAVKANNMDAIQSLIKAGADLNKTSPAGLTPLMCAVQSGNEKLIEVFCDLKADVNAQDHDGWSALHWAATKDQPEIVSLLINRGVDPTLKNHKDETARAVAQRKGNSKVVEALDVK